MAKHGILEFGVIFLSIWTVVSVILVIEMSLTDGDNISQARLRRLQSSLPASYTIYKDGATYRAECNIAGGTDYSGSDPVTVIHNARDAIASTGGKIFLKPGIYESNTFPIILNADGLILEGSGSGREQEYFTAPPSPLARLTKGTILKNTGTNLDTIQTTGKRFGVAIKHLAIDFTQSSTGHGIYLKQGTNDQGLSQFHIEDVFVNDNALDTYGLIMENPCLGYVEHFTCYGGGLLKIDLKTTTPTQFNCGNIQFNDIFSWITKAMTASPFLTTRTAASGMIGLCEFNRLQMNCHVDLATVPAMTMTYLQFSQFNALDLECKTDHAVSLGGCHHITFVEPMCSETDCDNWSVYTDCSNIRYLGGYINCAVDDKHATDTFFGTWMLSISGTHVAKLIDCKVGATNKLTNNRGKATIANGTASIAVTHGLHTTPTNIILTGTHTEVHEAYATSVGSATFTITVDGNTTDDRDVYWQASTNQ